MPTTVLSNLERRAIGNLSIPRNIPDLAHMLRQDPHAPTLPEADVAELLPELADAGLVVNLGEHEDLAKLAASLEKHKTAHAMPDDKAAIYVERLSHATRTWRRQGELWMLTEDGLAQLTTPGPEQGEYATSTADLERVIAAEYQRIATSPDGPLADRLLEDEFRAWADQVVAVHKAETGEAPRLPIGGGAGYSDATELLVLAADTGGTAYGETSPTFMALTTVAVTDADTGTSITEANYTGYARKSVANTDFNSAAAGAHTTANAITFAAATAGTSTVIGFARCVAVTVGRLIRFGTCASTVVSATNTPASFAAGAYSDTLD